MKVSFRREMRHNYMIIEPEELLCQNYECQMLEQNKVSGLLRFQIRLTDGNRLYYYEISSRQPLDRLLEGKSLSYGEIKSLVTGIAGVLDQMERYLLQESSILLTPEYIYVEPESFRVWLCLVPGLGCNFPEAYGKLLEYILGKVDHQDKEGVVLAYGIYQATRKENYGMDDILCLLHHDTAEQPPTEPVLERREGVADFLEKNAEAEICREEAAKKEADAPATIWERIRRFFGRKQKGTPPKEQEALSWQEMFKDGQEPAFSNPQMWEPEPVKAPVSDFVPSGEGTVLLSDFTPAETCRRLKSLDSGGEDIPLSYYPFIIGKQENLVDYYLNDETVSRLHARIDRDGDSYRIMDLNSTNGTAVRGVLLENNQAVSLSPGDLVQIARQQYRFE